MGAEDAGETLVANFFRAAMLQFDCFLLRPSADLGAPVDAGGAGLGASNGADSCDEFATQLGVTVDDLDSGVWLLTPRGVMLPDWAAAKALRVVAPAAAC